MHTLRDLVLCTRSGGLKGSELPDLTITVTELGDRGVVTPPQVALVGFGKVMERPWAEHGLVGARPVVMALLSADHRASDGHRGGGSSCRPSTTCSRSRREAVLTVVEGS